jgi:hypothetical protein
MRNFIFMLVAHLSLATQVASPLAGLAAVSVSAHAQAEIQTNIQKQIVFDTGSTQPVLAKIAVAPNFDTEVLAPLRAKQAAEAQAKASAKRVVVRRVAVAQVAPTADLLYRLRLCESGGTYNRNSGNGYYGAYQYAISSWGGYGGYARADLAPAEVQDAKVMADIAVRGWYPWPACARKIGVL